MYCIKNYLLYYLSFHKNIQNILCFVPLSIVGYLYFSNNYKSVCLFLLSFALVQYISVVYITSVNSTRLNFFALAEKTQASSDKSFSSKNIEKTVVCDATGVNSLSIRILLPLS